MESLNKPNQDEQIQKELNLDEQYQLNQIQYEKVESHKREVCLVFIGETGAGKTTLLKSLEDKMNNTPFEKRQITPKSQELGKSQTKDCNQFILTNDVWNVKVIDTPGLADTEGLSSDEAHLKQIVDFLIENSEFNTICFIIKSGTNRCLLHIKYVITELKSMLPKDAVNNFIVCLTYSDLPIPGAETLAVINDLGLPEDNIIPIDNKAYQEYKYNAKTISGTMIEQQLKNSYENNKSNLEFLLQESSKFKIYKSEGIQQLKTKRDLLKEEIALLSHKIDDCIHAQNQMTNVVREIEHVLKDIDANKNYVIKATIQRKVPYKKIGKVTTNCNACNKACHIDCSLSYGDDLSLCGAMEGAYCGKCGCHYGEHTHLGWDFNVEYEDATKDDENKKNRHKTALSKKQQLDEQLVIIREKIQKEEDRKEEYQNKIRDLYSQINEIALVGHNHVYEEFMMAQLKQLDKSAESHEFVERKRSYLELALKYFRAFKETVKKYIFN